MNTIISCLGFASKNNPRESSEKQRGGKLKVVHVASCRRCCALPENVTHLVRPWRVWGNTGGHLSAQFGNLGTDNIFSIAIPGGSSEGAL